MQIFLERQKIAQKNWEQLIANLCELYYLKHKKQPNNIFGDVNFLKEYSGLHIRAYGSSIYFLNPYPYTKMEKHYIIFQNPQAKNKFLWFHAANIILRAENPDNWIVAKLKDSTLAIHNNQPHVHLLLF